MGLIAVDITCSISISGHIIIILALAFVGLGRSDNGRGFGIFLWSVCLGRRSSSGVFCLSSSIRLKMARGSLRWKGGSGSHLVDNYFWQNQTYRLVAFLLMTKFTPVRCVCVCLRVKMKNMRQFYIQSIRVAMESCFMCGKNVVSAFDYLIFVKLLNFRI